MKTLSLRILIFTISAFALSYVCAAIGHIDDKDKFPISLASPYKKAIINVMPIEIHRELSADGITELDFSAVATDVEIKTTSSATININLKGNFPVSERGSKEDVLSVTSDNDKGLLNVRVQERSQQNGFLNFDISAGEGQMIIEVPQSLQHLYIKTVSGNIKLPSAAFEKIGVKTVSGEVLGQDLNVKILDSESVSGDFKLEGVLENLNTHTVSGDSQISFKNMAPEMKGKSTSGEFHLKFPGKPDAEINLKSVSGEMYYDQASDDDSDSDNRKHRYRSGQGRGRIELKTVSGDVHINN